MPFIIDTNLKLRLSEEAYRFNDELDIDDELPEVEGSILGAIIGLGLQHRAGVTRRFIEELGQDLCNYLVGVFYPGAVVNPAGPLASSDRTTSLGPQANSPRPASAPPRRLSSTSNAGEDNEPPSIASNPVAEIPEDREEQNGLGLHPANIALLPNSPNEEPALPLAPSTPLHRSPTQPIPEHLDDDIVESDLDIPATIDSSPLSSVPPSPRLPRGMQEAVYKGADLTQWENRLKSFFRRKSQGQGRASVNNSGLKRKAEHGEQIDQHRTGIAGHLEVPTDISRPPQGTQRAPIHMTKTKRPRTSAPARIARTPPPVAGPSRFQGSLNTELSPRPHNSSQAPCPAPPSRIPRRSKARRSGLS